MPSQLVNYPLRLPPALKQAAERAAAADHRSLNNWILDLIDREVRSMTQNTRTHWTTLRLVDGDGDDLATHGDARLTAALNEYRTTGSIDGAFFRPLGLPHEVADDASTHGPASPTDVDWTGFDA